MENTKEQMQMLAFQIIAYVGEARSKYIEAVKVAKNCDFEQAKEIIEEGRALHAKASHLHLDLVQKEALGEDLPFSLLLMHAEDQMLTNECFKFTCEELIEVYAKFNE